MYSSKIDKKWKSLCLIMNGHFCRFDFSLMKYLCFYFQASVSFKKKIFSSGPQIVRLASLCDAGPSAWQGERPLLFNKLQNGSGLSQKAGRAFGNLL